MFYRSLITIFLFLSLTFLAAQEFEFGEIPDEEFAITSIPGDPDADIIILCDRAEICITPEFRMQMKVHKRVKILTEAGKEFAKNEINYYYKDNIMNLEGVTYRPDGEEIELDEDNVFEEEFRKRKSKKFAMPGVEAGSIYEFQYTLYSDYITNLEPWYFQSGEYTRYSELSFLKPGGFNYSALQYHFGKHNIEMKAEEVWDPFKQGKRIQKYSWVAKDIPAIKKEPYITAFKDYYAHILFQIVAYKDPYRYIEFAKSWNAIAENIYPRFERLMEESDVEDLVLKLTSSFTDSLNKAEALYNYVTFEINTESSYGWYPEKEPEEILEEKKGDANEKNTLLLSLLHHAGINASPLLLSTRNNGRINTDWAQATQFNRTIVYLNLNGKKLFLDTSNKQCPFGYLSPEVNVNIGLLLGDEKGEIIPIDALKSKNTINIETTASLTENGTLEAESKIIFNGYDALKERNSVANTSKPEEYISGKFEDFSGITKVDTFYYSNLDSLSKPLELNIRYSIKDYINQSDSLVYLAIPYISGFHKNPFIKEKRDFPIDFPYEYLISESFILNAPDFTLIEQPQFKSLQHKKISYSKVYFYNDKKLECRRSFKIGDKSFSSSDYQKIRDNYDQFIESDQEIILLKAKQDTGV